MGRQLADNPRLWECAVLFVTPQKTCPDLQQQAEPALSAFQPRKAVPSSYLLSTTKVCILAD
eukprot:1047383-Pelagomonas_calceolata.AAC.2